VPYLIDGHNLIGQLDGVSLADPDDEAKLVAQLRSFMARQRKRCTVVFDQGLPGGPSRELSTHSVRVVFAHSGTTADRIILERIRNVRDTAGLIVISADHEIIEAARRRQVQVIPPAVFARQMEAPVPPQEDARARDPNPRLSSAEVEDWLRLFGESPPENDDGGPS
jgi:hypothetical protein